MIAWVAAAWAGCAPEALVALAEGLAEDAGPAQVGPALAAACDGPPGWVRALGAPADPYLDQQGAIGQVALWEQACPGGLSALPSGHGPATPGARLALWDRCELEGLGLFGVDAWIAASGPPVTTVLAAHLLHRQRAPQAVRARLVRALAGVATLPEAPSEPVVIPGPPDPLDAFAEVVPPRLVVLGRMAWPTGTAAGTTCTVRARIVDDGKPGAILFGACPERARSAATAALEDSWFNVGRRAGRSDPALVEITFTHAP